MISELAIDDLNRSCVHHAREVPFLKEHDRVGFKPGLNILWGGNGTGKSTILSAIARMLHCEQGGRTCVTKDSLGAVFEVPSADPKSRFGERSDTLADGVVPIHDGQCVLHFDPGHAVGLAFGGAAFDWDFAGAGVANTMFRGSSGQVTLERCNEVLYTIVKPEKWPKIEWKVSQKGEYYAPRTSQVEAFLKGTLEQGQPTVLLDEPDRSLSMKLQAGLWTNLAARYSKNVQIIAASHSPLALHLPGVNYIEMTPGYLAECEGVLDSHVLGHLFPDGKG